MNAVSRNPDAVRLRAIRENLAAIAPARWTRVHQGEGCFVESQGEMGELFVLARFDPGATIDEITFVVDAPERIAFLLRLLDQAFDQIRKLKGMPDPRRQDKPERAPKDFAAECAMKCAEPAFRVFLEAVHGLERPLTDERVVQRVRGLLGVQSRAELNEAGRAADAWKALRGEFDAWRRAGR
jgi:hypothetical protein